jgi:hypothetical protein
VIVKEETLLHYNSQLWHKVRMRQQLNLHLLKLVTGVDISTRAVSKSGRPGNEVKSRSRTAAAAPKRAAFLLSTLIVDVKGE